MDLARALVLGVVDYFVVFAVFVAAELASLSYGPVAVSVFVMNVFVVSLLAYYYFKHAGVSASKDGLVLGGLWAVVAIVLEVAIRGWFLGNGLTVLSSVMFLLYNTERLLLPLVFSSGLIETKK